MINKELQLENINVQKVRFGDIMFNIWKEQTHLEAKILANEEMIIEYTQENNTEMIQYCQGKIEAYKETLNILDNISHSIYKKIL
jgi:adenylate kinase